MLNMRHANQEPLTQKTQANTYVFFSNTQKMGRPTRLQRIPPPIQAQGFLFL